MVTTKWHSHVISAPHVLSPPDGWTAMRGVRTTIHCTLDLSARHIPSLHCPRKNHWTSQGTLYRFYDFVVWICTFGSFVGFVQFMLSQRWSQHKITGAENKLSRQVADTEKANGSVTQLCGFENVIVTIIYSCLKSWLSSSRMVGDTVQLHVFFLGNGTCLVPLFEFWATDGTGSVPTFCQ